MTTTPRLIKKSSCHTSSKPDVAIVPRIMSEYYTNDIHYFIVAVENSLEDSLIDDVLRNFFKKKAVSKFSKIATFILNNIRCFVVEASPENEPNKEDLSTILTARELQIASLVAHGDPNKKIAKKLHISEWTVATHIRRIFAKLSVDSRAAMVYRCANSIQHLKL